MAAPDRIARFGPFEARLATGELLRAGEPVVLQELPFRLLAALLERPGVLVTREELRAVLWPPGVFVDFEHGLNKAASKLRRALDEPAGQPGCVETLPRRGYRFIGEVRWSDAPSPNAPAASCRILWDLRTFPLPEGVNVVGRDASAAVCLDSSTVSRRHARIVVSGGVAVVEDLDSKNGTFLAGRRVDAPLPLSDGDEITFGSVVVRFNSTPGETTCTVAPHTNTGSGRAPG